MTDEKEKTEKEYRVYVLVHENGDEDWGLDARSPKEVAAAIAAARKKAVAKENMITFSEAPLLEGDDEGDGIVYVFEPLSIKRLRTPYEPDEDDPEDGEEGEGDGATETDGEHGTQADLGSMFLKPLEGGAAAPVGS